MHHRSSSEPFTIAAPQVFYGTAMRGPAMVRISDGRIESISFSDAQSGAPIELPADAILAPGFIDILVNGGGGVLLNEEPTEAGVRRIVQAHRRTGTTGCLPTLITDRTEVIERLAAAAQASLQIPGVLGLDSELGLIAPGYRADLVAFNANFEVIETWIAGRSDGSTL